MENLTLQCSEPMQLHKVLSVPAIYQGDPIEYEGRSVKVDFANIRFADTPVLMDDQMVGVAPRRAVQTSGGRLRCSHGKFTSKDFTSLIGKQIQTGAILEPFEMDGDTVISSKLKAFTVEPASKQYRTGSPGTTDDDALAESLFQASGGGPQATPKQDEPPRRVEDRGAQVTHYGRQTPAADDNDDIVVDRLFNATKGCQTSDPVKVPQSDPPRRPERKTDYVGSGYQNNRVDSDDEDEAIANQLFQASQ